ncbi:MAG: Zn-dependent hydrolase, partial [Gammaproteobacteria bacterium]|nr:Zn-dependent hydrolase [Gammaproteobacteria bacterium]
NQREMVRLLVRAAQIMDELFWKQAYGNDHEAWLASIADPELRLFARQNYGPWDRLDGDKPFISGVDAKPPGANFYPREMTKEDFEMAYLPGKAGLYSLVRRDAEGQLKLIPYHVAYADELKAAAMLLREAAGLAESSDFANYLKLRANALLSDDYQMSDLYWMDVKDNEFDLIIGPIETYEDQLFGYRAAYAAYVLLKDLDWSAQLVRYTDLLPELQRNLPVDAAYKQEYPGSDAELNAYDVMYYAGYANAGAKTIAVNLPNDEEVQMQKGTRRLQLKNAMQAKFERILTPIADLLIDESQRRHVTFEAFFANTMFHEVAHGLGIKNTITGKGTVRQALKEVASSMEEGKADILGLYMITELHKAGELGDVDLKDYYVSFMASVFRSIRFGASSAHGKANMVRFNYFVDSGAFVRDTESGRYRIDFERMQESIAGLSRLLLTLQGDGDYAGASELTNSKGIIGAQLQADLDRLMQASIPVDITFRQGLAEIGLE